MGPCIKIIHLKHARNAQEPPKASGHNQTNDQTPKFFRSKTTNIQPIQTDHPSIKFVKTRNPSIKFVKTRNASPITDQTSSLTRDASPKFVKTPKFDPPTFSNETPKELPRQAIPSTY